MSFRLARVALVSSLFLVPHMSGIPANAQGYHEIPLMLFGEAAPVPPPCSAAYAETVDIPPPAPSVSPSGDVAFIANAFDPACPIDAMGIFTISGAAHTAIALAGDSAPGTGEAFEGFLSVSVNDSGQVAFLGAWLEPDPPFPPTFGNGIFLASGGPVTDIALENRPAPPSVGGTYRFLWNPSISGSGDVTFAASMLGGTASEGVFRFSGGTTTPVALEGDAAPGTGGTFDGFDIFPEISAGGDIVFGARIAGGTTSAGLFVQSGAVISAIALAGGVAPGTSGGTFSGFESPAINDLGGVVVVAGVAGGSSSQGVFVFSGGSTQTVALEGDPAPLTGGGTFVPVLPPPFAPMAFFHPSISDTGDVAFWGLTSAAAGPGVFAGNGDTLKGVSVIGHPAPEGGSFSSLSPPSIDASGRVVFGGYVDGGAGGHYRAVLATVPVIDRSGLLIASLALATAGSLAIRRRLGPPGRSRPPQPRRGAT